MRIITHKRIAQFWAIHSEAKTSLKSWYAVAKKADWQNLDDVQTTYPHADLVGDCVVFNIGGNKFRLITKINYRTHKVFIRNVLTHKDYDRGKWKDDCNC